jgi:hypothetical protein
MAKNAVTDWDTTAANNTDISGISIAEGCPASGINDAIRALMAQIGSWIAATTGPLLRVAANTIANGTMIMDGASTPVARNIGYRSVPTSRSVTTSATVALADEGMRIKSTGGGLVVPNNTTLAIPIDFMTSFYNNSGSAQTISGGVGVAFQIEGNASTQSTVSVPKFTRAFLEQVSANTWVVSGKAVA